MKPLHTVLLALACSFGGAALAWLMLDQTHQSKVAVAPADTTDDERVAKLESEVAGLNSKIDDLMKLQLEPRPTPEPAPRPTEDVSAPEGEDTVAPKPASAEKIDEIAKRLAEIERRDAAILEKAINDLHNGDGDAQEEAAILLGQRAAQGDEAAKKAIRDAMKSEDAEVREWAIEALVDTGLVEFIPDLKAMMQDPEAEVREEITQALESMPADQAGPLLVSMLGDEDGEVLEGAIEVIADLEYKEALTDLLPLTRHTDERVAIEASIAMAELGDSTAAEGWVPTLGSRLNSTDVEERRLAMRSLRQMRLESARSYFEQGLNDEDWRVRRDAERGLRRLNGD